MPYIKNEDRKSYLLLTNQIETTKVQNSGHLNYLITLMLVNYLEHHGTTYNTVNDIVGTLNCASLEFYRRVGIPLENLKKSENGDVY